MKKKECDSANINNRKFIPMIMLVLIVIDTYMEN